MQDGDSQKASGDPSPEASHAQAMGCRKEKRLPSVTYRYTQTHTITDLY